jgi:hypothetical protein
MPNRPASSRAPHRVSPPLHQRVTQLSFATKAARLQELRNTDSRFDFCICHLEAIACDNDFPTPEYKIPIEARLIKYLRVWRDNPNAVTPTDRNIEKEIASLLERYIDDCLWYGPKNRSAWWSEGVVRLEIKQTTLDVFKLLGVTWIDCHGVAPFEIDVEMNPADDHHFAKTTFRIGTLDDRGCPQIIDHRKDEGRVLEMRPRHNRDWAMAVELTPPSTS